MYSTYTHIYTYIIVNNLYFLLFLKYYTLVFQEANGELQSANPSLLHPHLHPTCGFNRQWSLVQLIAEFNELCRWLTHVQEEIYSSPENLVSRQLRMVRGTRTTPVTHTNMARLFHMRGCGVYQVYKGNWKLERTIFFICKKMINK